MREIAFQYDTVYYILDRLNENKPAEPDEIRSMLPRRCSLEPSLDFLQYNQVVFFQINFKVQLGSNQKVRFTIVFKRIF